MLNKYNDFLLESIMYDFLLESKLIYTHEFSDILSELSSNSNPSISKVAKFLLSIANDDMKLVQNFIGIDKDNDKVSFVPDNKIKLDTNYFSLDIKDGMLQQIVGNHPILDKLSIPREGIHFINMVEELNGLPNIWSVVKKYDGADAGNDFRVYTLYHIRNKKDPNYFLVVCDNSRQNIKALFDYYDVPEARSNIKIGRFINRIMDIFFKDKDGSSRWVREDFTDSDIEKFVNAYTATILFNRDAMSFFEVVDGDLIKHWYNVENYETLNGQLGSSCMRHKSCQKYFDIYTKNPDVCKLLIFKGVDNTKIRGRALLWTDINSNKWIDRIYTSRDNYHRLFINWAEINGYKECYDEELSLTVEIKNEDYEYFPYMDTFYVYKESEDKDSPSHLYSDTIADRPYYRLQETDGSYTTRS